MLQCNIHNHTMVLNYYIDGFLARISLNSSLRSRPKLLSDQTFQAQVTSDQTFQAQRVSDQTFQTKGVLLRPSSDHSLDSNSNHCPDLNQTMIRLKCAPRGYGQTQLRLQPIMTRLKCARNILIRKRFHL